ncbi:DoxX family membrane protein [Paenibacillus sp. GCM10027627]|uniref:DoxX family membrane protein n=1 Tax=unclassified Paenibacillus TaxID=185978 RepID=UPI00363714F4
MIKKFWSENVWMAGLATIIRILLGYKWLDAGWNKLTGVETFDASGYVNNALANPVMDRATGEAMYPTYNAFLEHFALPNIDMINFLVPWGEFLVGLGLILGTLTLPAVFFGLMLNFIFMFSGSVSMNPWLLLLGFIIMLAGSNAGRFGGDRFVLPWIKATCSKLFGSGAKSDGVTAGNS